ncbi:T9SS type A sorting domain-containing protein [uncultured Dokdonia sp.]|uniref:T9SS type A sorting domain-containing protein n=1 Tax=uncultured Dokdonia sp. TaxID=575653 RepID=UPI0026117A36|nr:T9SS type A sorting domain-containing protein [uncultured Dokdonia sp.]
MKFPLLFILIPFVAFGQVQIGQSIDGESIGDLSGTNVSISSDGNIVAIGAFDNDGNGTNSGHVRVYENQGGIWNQIGQDIDGEAIGDLSGTSVSLSCDGSIVAIGASNNNNNTGHVRVYALNNGTWSQIGQDIDGNSSQRFFGRSVSLSCDGRIVAIGSNLNSANSAVSGQVGIYRNQGNNWVRIGNNINDTVATNVLGTTVSLSNNGNIVAIGTPFDTGDGVLSGNVRVFKNQGDAWTQIGEEIISNMTGDQFGRGLSLSGDGTVLAVSSMVNNTVGNNQTGHVSIYKDEGGQWEQIGSDIIGEMAGDKFGRGLSLSDDGSIVAIGARLNNGNGFSSGHVRVFQNESNLWRQIGDDIDGEMPGDQSGISVSLSANGLIVAIGSNLSNGGKGEVRMFDLSDTLLSVKEEQSITTRVKLFPNPAPSNVTIELPEEQAVVIQNITMYNSLGQRVFSTQETNIDTTQFPKGIYFIEIRTTEGIASKRLIVD